jgi:5-methylthioribose kinase
MDLRKKFKDIHPDVIFLEQQMDAALEAYLKDRKWLADQEKITSIEKPGEGNMNFVIRIRTGQHTMVLKQSRPWVQKYPQISAPIERIYVEYNFYRFIAPHQNISRFTPAVLGFDPENYVLLLEDLGQGADYTYLYQKDHQLATDELQALAGLLSTLHQVEVAERDRQFFDNQAMKELNHEHIFVFPYQLDNGFDLDQVQAGLQPLSFKYKQNKKLKSIIAELGRIYLQNDTVLLHGDYYPGSWLKVADGLRLIDPEFSYFGKAEFDLGVMLAHLKMSRHTDVAVDQVLKHYEKPRGFEDHLMWAFAGVEMMRRIIGLAQLPLSLSLKEKESLLEESVRLIDHYQK